MSTRTVGALTADEISETPRIDSGFEMKASPLLISWHNDNAPIYSAHFEPQGKGRLATSGGDNNVRLWRVTVEGEERRVTYLSTLIKVLIRTLD